MFLSLARGLRRRSQGDEGVAMIMVMGTIMVLTLLLGVIMTYALSVQPQARKDQDWNSALAVAQAGVDDYVARLNQNDSYWTSVDCSNQALKGPKAGTNSCGWTTSTAPGWQDVKVGNPGAGRFHYDVDPSAIWTQGGIQVTSTGKVRNVSRTLQVLVSRGGPTQYLYYTDFEDADPASQVVYPGGPSSAACGKYGASQAKYWYQGRSGCVEIQFVAYDVLDGKVHFNDTPLLGGSATFRQGFETAEPNCKKTPYNPNNCTRSGNPSPTLPGSAKATYSSPLYLPDNSDQFATYPGCVYTGDTRIRFNSNGTMDVWNTMSKGTTILGPGTPAGTNCGNAANFKPSGTGANPLAPASKQTVPVPNDMVIYVKNSGSSAACTPGQIVNGTSSGSTSNDVLPTGTGTDASGVTDIAFFDPDSISTTVTQTFTRSATNQPWNPGPQTTSGPNVSGDGHDPTWNCGQGNLYVEGTVKGRVTIAAQNNIVVTGDLLIPSVNPPLDGGGNVKVAGGTDMLGLVAANSVAIYHPVSRSTSSSSNVSGSYCNNSVGTAPSTTYRAGTSKTCTWTDSTNYGNSYSDISYPYQTNSSGRRYIYGSIQTLQHSFWVMNFNKGTSLGKLTVRGSIAQKWRGIVGTGTTATTTNTGYLKDYGYDTRLVHASPPYFPQWTNAVWGAQTTGELKPQY